MKLDKDDLEEEVVENVYEKESPNYLFTKFQNELGPALEEAN